MQQKSRLSVSVDPDVAEAAHAAVAAGRADSISSWVNRALRLQMEHDRRMAAMDAYMAAYQAEFGEITAEEIAEVERRMKERAIVVRGNPRRRAKA